MGLCPFLVDDDGKEGEGVGGGLVGWAVDLQPVVGAVGLEPDQEVDRDVSHQGVAELLGAG